MTFFHCSMVLFWCSHAQCRHFWSGSLWAYWPVCSYGAIYTANVMCVCSDTISCPALCFIGTRATVALLCDRRSSLRSPCLSMSLGRPDASSTLVLFVGISISFGDALTQSSSHYYLALVKVTLYSLVYFSSFQHTKFKNWLFTWC